MGELTALSQPLTGFKGKGSGRGKEKGTEEGTIGGMPPNVHDGSTPLVFLT